jgi:soluble P-type ATPase
MSNAFDDLDPGTRPIEPIGSIHWTNPPAFRNLGTMLSISIPGFSNLRLVDLVCDFNGTLAQDGRLLPGVGQLLGALAADLRVHVVTADTHGGAARELQGLPVSVDVIAPVNQAAAKRAFVERLGASGVVALGNGRNDREMLAVAAVGIVVMQGEGAAPETLASADVVVSSAVDALELLRHPQRLVATLRE